MVCENFDDLVMCLKDTNRKEPIKISKELYNKIKWNSQDNYGAANSKAFSSISFICVDESAEFRNKLKNKKLTQEELEDIMYKEDLPEDFIYIDREEYDDINDWQRSCRVIFKDVKENKYYALNYFKGLGEYQPNKVDEQPYEVTPVEKTIIVFEDVEEEIL